MTRLNCASTTKAYLLDILYTERRNGDFFPLVVTVLPVVVLIDSFPSGQERCHWFILALIRVSVAKFDFNYGFNFSIP